MKTCGIHYRENLRAVVSVSLAQNRRRWEKGGTRNEMKAGRSLGRKAGLQAKPARKGRLRLRSSYLIVSTLWLPPRPVSLVLQAGKPRLRGQEETCPEVSGQGWQGWLRAL